MGQRLVVTIENNQKQLAKIYYHWSAYTGSALYETKKIIDCIYNHKDETESELLLRLIRFCENNGGGIAGTDDASEHKYIQTLFPNETFKTEDYSRSNGIIALSNKCMDDLQKWSEGDVFINLDTDQVDFCVYCGYESLEEYIEERKSWDDEFEEFTLEELDYVDYNLGIFDVKDIDGLIVAFENAEDNRNVIRFKDEIVELI